MFVRIPKSPGLYAVLEYRFDIPDGLNANKYCRLKFYGDDYDSREALIIAWNRIEFSKFHEAGVKMAALEDERNKLVKEVLELKRHYREEKLWFGFGTSDQKELFQQIKRLGREIDDYDRRISEISNDRFHLPENQYSLAKDFLIYNGFGFSHQVSSGYMGMNHTEVWIKVQGIESES